MSDTLVILDDLPLRRAQIAAFLQPWCDDRKLAMKAMSSDEIEAIGSIEGVRIVLLSVGGSEASKCDPAGLLAALQTIVPGAAFVITGDMIRPLDMVLALKAGVVGFIPNDLPPQLALNALDFIIEGGHFFPAPAAEAPPSHLNS